MENLDAAIADFRSAIKCDPSKKDYMILLVRALFASGRIDEAIEGSYYGIFVSSYCYAKCFLLVSFRSRIELMKRKHEKKKERMEKL
jgi:hypothetical protein